MKTASRAFIDDLFDREFSREFSSDTGNGSVARRLCTITGHVDHSAAVSQKAIHCIDRMNLTVPNGGGNIWPGGNSVIREAERNAQSIPVV
ncbi:hypothetical protein [Streptomyces sp. MNU77]|uniref:hypothetical protein n=1 Tax=Streptomyces sp. MNU77 TaxID=1573406 RepID=UPI00117D5F91|nr:hypothetical protein [Streptomyces sp. MNU77]